MIHDAADRARAPRKTRAKATAKAIGRPVAEVAAVLPESEAEPASMGPPQIGPDGEPPARRRMGREVERVLEAIVADISSGQIRPGAKLNGPELSRRLGVSRGPLREAIRRLEERQLVQFTPNAGARVVLHSPEEVIQFFYVREALEGMAARLAARTMTDEELADLRSIYEGEVARGGTLGGRNDFHMRIVRGAYHPRLSRMLNEDFYTLYRMWRANFEWLRAGGQRSWNDHHRILEALEQRDGELAEMMVRRHIIRLREQAEENLRRMREPRLVGT